jgi:hypothetical protein
VKHPFDISDKKKVARIHPEVTNIDEVNPISQIYLTLPDEPSQHSWVAGVLYPARLSKGREEGELTILMDASTAVGEVAPRCFVCAQEVSPEVFEQPCPGSPDGIFYPTKRQFVAWSVDDKFAWLKEFYTAKAEGLE